MKTENIGQCQLCLLEKPLAESHIIPEFLYKPLYDEIHRALVFRGDQSQKEKYLQNGIRERMLCRGEGSCEELFGKWETYASQALTHKSFVRDNYKDAIVVKGVDYAKYKLFQMSILWRICASKKPEFGQVALGQHQERLRQMLFDRNPGDPSDYGCMILVRRNSFEWENRFIVSPVMGYLEGHRVVEIIINGLLMRYYVSNHTAKLSALKRFLSAEGELPFVLMPTRVYDDLILRITKGLMW